MSDQATWQALQAGDRDAFARIYRDHIDALLRYGYRFGAEPALIEDCVQDLFVHLWRRRAHLSATTAIRPYLLVALRHRLLKALAQAQREEAPAETVPFVAEPAIDQQLIAAEQDAETQARLQTAMQALSERQREALYLKYYLDLSYDDLCTVMELSYQSARNLVAAGLKALRRHLSALVTWLLWCGWPGG